MPDEIKQREHVPEKWRLVFSDLCHKKNLSVEERQIVALIADLAEAQREIRELDNEIARRSPHGIA